MTSKQARRVAAASLALAGLLVSTAMYEGHPAVPEAHSVKLQVPEFSVKWRRERLSMVGHTLSAAHERSLLQRAKQSYSDKFSHDFLPHGGVPAHWPTSTLQALELLTDMESGHVRVSTEAFSVSGIVTDKSAWRDAVAMLQASLPPGVLLHEDVIVIDPSLQATELCERAFETFDVGPVSFQESTATLRSSAYPHLQRLAAIADACRTATVSIAGHTDASGDAAWNKALSLRRAEAVADYLVSVGIARDRIEVTGEGSAVPVADNATRYGRSLNRRIEIKLTQPPS